MVGTAILSERAWTAPAPARVSAQAAPALPPRVQPRLTFAAAVILLPVIVLAAVTTLAASVMVPVALLMGWL